MFLNPGDSGRRQQMNCQTKPVCVRIPAGRDNKFKVLNFNEGSFTKVQAGCKEPPCDGEAPGLNWLEALILLCLNKAGDGGVTRPEELGPSRKGAEKRGPRPTKGSLSSPGAFWWPNPNGNQKPGSSGCSTERASLFELAGDRRWISKRRKQHPVLTED